MNRCRRCGKETEKNTDLRCKECRKLVDQEFKGEISRPFRFYFTFYRDDFSKNKNLH